MNNFSHQSVALFRQYLPEHLSLESLLILFCCATLLLFLVALSLLVSRSRLSQDLAKNNQKLRDAKNVVNQAVEKSKQQNIRIAQLTTLLQSEKKHAAEKLQLLERAREELKLQFSSLAQTIFEEKSARFSELNQEKLDTILTPFSNQLGALKQEINDIYRTDSRERISLKTEISQLRHLNQQINQEAANLTNALKNNTKVQGNWGELVLERVLEQSGLRQGIEYETQNGYRNHENRLFKPDVVIHLPEGKDIIIDSKVSLISWEQFVNCDDESLRAHHLNNLVKAIRDHVKGLGNKNYQNLSGLHSLDFILMFMPIESAFSVAVQTSSTLIDEALTHNIIIVTPTTLLATLRTIENIWQFDQQSKNSQEIARRAGLMYDKFRGFVDDLEKIGKQLATCNNSYESALAKLSRGRGNLVAQTEQLRQLGVQVKKELPKTITQGADASDFDLKN